MDAILILDREGSEELVTDDLARLLTRLEPVAADLGCSSELAAIAEIALVGASYQRQRAVSQTHGGRLDAVVAHLVEEMREGRPVLHRT